ncbi:MAG: hypothetical protein KF760_25270 [Candidatus Eremiobacteraeota bacterium]|nr:hypothetical protein [Candidatus Eremiobacteraeota bacterium]MCW5872114.1 hypothetical protein [Candidatus Eremiobacteraeota bacterium]
MSLIIWAATHEGLLVASDQQDPPNIFHIGTMLLAVAGQLPDFTKKITAYLGKHEVDLASPLHVEALRTVVCQTLEQLGEGELTAAFGQHNHGLSGIVLMTVKSQAGKARLTGFETREYTGESETEYIPLGDQAQDFLSKVARHPNYIKTLRQKKIRFVKDLNLETARKIAREMIRDTYLSANKKPPEVDAHHT